MRPTHLCRHIAGFARWYRFNALAGLFSLFLLGCFPSSRIDFHICGDIDYPDDIDALRLIVLDTSMEELHAGVLELESGLPVSSAIPSGSGAGWVKVQGLKDTISAIVFARRVGDLDGTDSVDIKLTKDCLGVDCPLGQTCVAGACVLAPVGTDTPHCP